MVVRISLQHLVTKMVSTFPVTPTTKSNAHVVVIDSRVPKGKIECGKALDSQGLSRFTCVQLLETFASGSMVVLYLGSFQAKIFSQAVVGASFVTVGGTMKTHEMQCENIQGKKRTIYEK